MGDATAPKGKGWADAEKAELYLAIAVKLEKIPWSELALPEGRTEKACKLMFDKERTQFRIKHGIAKPGKSDGEENGTAPAKKTSPKKRKTDKNDEEKPAAKKGKKTSKAKAKEPSAEPESDTNMESP